MKGASALETAHRIQSEASRVGFEFPSPESAWRKVEEESRELRELVVARRERTREIADELGDLLFAVVNYARLLGIDPEQALAGTNAKFARRFAYIEKRLAARGRTPAGSTLDEMDRLWDEAKERES